MLMIRTLLLREKMLTTTVAKGVTALIKQRTQTLEDVEKLLSLTLYIIITTFNTLHHYYI